MVCRYMLRPSSFLIRFNVTIVTITYLGFCNANKANSKHKNCPPARKLLIKPKRDFQCKNARAGGKERKVEFVAISEFD